MQKEPVVDPKVRFTIKRTEKEAVKKRCSIKRPLLLLSLSSPLLYSDTSPEAEMRTSLEGVPERDPTASIAYTDEILGHKGI
jgi:hypothetical protein